MRSRLDRVLLALVGLAACAPTPQARPPLVEIEGEPRQTMVETPVASASPEPALWQGEARFRPHGDAAIAVTERDPVRGADDAPVTMVVFGDYQCPACGMLEPALDALVESVDESQLRLVWKHFPLRQHPHALVAAEAASAVLAAGDAEAFWRFHERAFEHQQMLSEENLRRWALELGIDAQRFEEARASAGVRAKVEADRQLGESLQVMGVPEVFVNCERLDLGAAPDLASGLRQAVEREIEAVRAAGNPRYPARCGARLRESPR